MKKYKETFANIMTGSCLEELQSLLDDHLLKILTIKGSVYAKYFESEISEVEEWLNYTSDMLEYTIKVQTVWMYL
jgi:dynein heavy chain, axonemal